MIRHKLKGSLKEDYPYERLKASPPLVKMI